MATTVFTPSGGVLNADDTNIGLAFRVRCVLSTGSNGKLQVTFTARSNIGLKAKHCSVGLSSSSTSSVTTTTPVELKFGGVSGFSIAAGASITSDLTDHSAVFSVSSGAAVIVCIDVDTPGGERYRTSNSNVDTYFVAFGTGLYNVADPATAGQTMTKLAGTDYTVEKVETNASGGTPQTITGTLYAGTDTTPGGVVSRGAVTLSGTLFSGTDAFPAATVSRGAVSVIGTLFTETNSFSAGVVSAGSIALAGTLYADPDTFPAATISVGAVTVAGSLFAETNTFGAGTVALPGAPQTITGTLFANDNAFPAGSVAERQLKHAGGWDDGGTRRTSGPRRVVFVYDPPQEEKKAEPVKRVKRKITRRVVQEAVAELPRAEAAILPPVSVLASLLPEFVSIPQANPAADAALLMHVVRMLAMQAAAQAAAEDEQDIELLLLAAA